MGFLTVSNLRKTFRDRKKPVEAVKAISFSVERGEMVGLLGPNGAGKTTTIKCILGLVKPDAGVITVNGVDCSKDQRMALRNMSAVLEGARNTYWRLTTWENIAYFAGLHGIPEKTGKEYFEYLLDVLRLREKRDTEVRNLSSGYKQKTAVACALAKKTPLVFLDEPTLGLDVESSYELREALRKLQSEEGRTILVSSHDMHVVQDICQRAVIISQGEVVADRTIPELLKLFGTRKYRVVVAGEGEDEVAGNAREAVGGAFPKASFRKVGGALEATVDLSDQGDIYRLVDVLKRAGAVLDSITQEEVDLEKAFLEIVRRGNGQCGS
jgi:ABC-2 type transport system ATP-binding protein